MKQEMCFVFTSTVALLTRQWDIVIFRFLITKIRYKMVIYCM